MLREFVASRAAKLIAACVCPVAGAGTLTVAVPEVRQAVHRATAPRTPPRQVARPATRPRVQPAVAAVECPPDLPLVLTSTAFRAEPQGPVPTSPLPPIATNGNQPLVPGSYVPVTPIGFVPVTPGPPGPNPPPPTNPPVTPIPEPQTWLQMLIGFGIAGVAFRSGWRRRHDYEPVEEEAA